MHGKTLVLMLVYLGFNDLNIFSELKFEVVMLDRLISGSVANVDER